MTFKRCTIERVNGEYNVSLIHSWLKLWEFAKFTESFDNIQDVVKWLANHPYDKSNIDKKSIKQIVKNLGMPNDWVDDGFITIDYIYTIGGNDSVSEMEINVIDNVKESVVTLDDLFDINSGNDGNVSEELEFKVKSQKPKFETKVKVSGFERSPSRINPVAIVKQPRRGRRRKRSRRKRR